MPRKARLDAPGALHHIIVRGIERRKIFRDDSDRDNFLNRLGGILLDSQTRCFAWSLMSNHFHLLLRTGLVPISNVMRRLLTGYAVNFNLKHRRSGHLFQNRYKSILCQEDAYLMELVRYIHLNPLRAKLVSDLDALDRYRFCGHGVLMGKCRNDWQDADYVLRQFGKRAWQSRKGYREFVHQGIGQGRRPELVGGGLVRSLGGWKAIKVLRGVGERIKGDERILGDGGFVETVLGASNERLERRAMLQAMGYDLDRLAERVAQLFEMPIGEVLRRGRYIRTVPARSVLCFWANRELGISTVELAKRFKIAQPTVTQSIARGEKIVAEKQLLMTADEKR
jgi:REP element-mobilizing transposase RayT